MGRVWRHFDPILGHCTIEETDERVSAIGRRLFRFRAQALADEHPPLINSYSLRVEKVPGVPFLYEVAAYQNVVIPNE